MQAVFCDEILRTQHKEGNPICAQWWRFTDDKQKHSVHTFTSHQSPFLTLGSRSECGARYASLSAAIVQTMCLRQDCVLNGKIKVTRKLNLIRRRESIKSLVKYEWIFCKTTFKFLNQMARTYSYAVPTIQHFSQNKFLFSF